MQDRITFFYAEAQELTDSITPRFPHLTVTASYASPDPVFEMTHFSVGVADPKVTDPPAQVLREVVDPCLHRHAPAAAGQLSNPMLEASE
ncbi:MAG: hypothetical protein SynsKO_44840 [Synoicihabitans sp.]